MGTDYKSDVTQVKNSHNISKNRKCGKIEKTSLDHNRINDSNINIMKTDSYNFLIGCILIINLAAFVGMFSYFSNTIEKYESRNEANYNLLVETLLGK